MSNVRGRRNLFELMSKTPEPQSMRSSKLGLSLPWRRSKNAETTMIVAEALTEEEAAAELAAQRAAAEEEERAKLEKLEARKKAKSDRQAARVTSENDIPTAVIDETKWDRQAKTPWWAVLLLPLQALASILPVRRDDGRLHWSLGTSGSIAVSALVVVLLIGAYSLGTRSNKKGLPTLRSTEAAPGVADPSLHQQSTTSDQNSPSGKTDFSAIQRAINPVETGVRANQPARVVNSENAIGGDSTRHNYLQIESFRITREKSSDLLRRELDDVRKFLAERGIGTQARLYPRGYVLYSTQGYLPSTDFRDQREAFQRRVEQLGEEYFRAGGLYQFKGCYFVSHSKAMSGQPAS